MTGSLTSRRKAVSEIATHLADQTAFVITVPPSLVTDVFYRLRNVLEWTGYVDNGQPNVWRLTTNAAAVVKTIATMESFGALFIAVITVPKTVPALELGCLLDCEVAADGSQDILGLRETWEEGEAPIIWPTLFVDALDKVSPKSAAAIRASDILGLS